MTNDISIKDFEVVNELLLITFSDSSEAEKVINNKSFTTSKFFIEILSVIVFPSKL